MNSFPFEPNASGRSLSNALALGRTALLVYESAEEVLEVLSNLGFAKHRFFDRNETQSVVAASDNMVLVAFRGTEPEKMQDLATDIKLRMTVGPVGKVHRGFLEALDAVWDDDDQEQSMLKTIDEFRTNNQPILVTGHSLGAALATLATARLKFENNTEVAGLYTYGCPRVGDETFAKAFNDALKDRAFRFVNNNDVVTRIPIPLKSLPYNHVGMLQYFAVDGVLSDDIGWWAQAIDRFKGRLEDLFVKGTDGIKDHDMGRYVAHLEKAAAD